MRVADAAAQQGGVDDQRFDKHVVRAAQRLAGGRLLYAAHRVTLGVDQRAGVEALGQQQRFAEENAGNRRFYAALGVDLSKGDIPVDERLHGCRLACGGLRKQKADHALDHGVVSVTVYGVDAAAPLSGVQVARDDVKAAPHAQKRIQPRDVLRKILSQQLHTALPKAFWNSMAAWSTKYAGAAMRAGGTGKKTFSHNKTDGHRKTSVRLVCLQGLPRGKRVYPI